MQKQPLIGSVLNFPLFHSTSTIFLESIRKHGLGGKDKIAEWKVLDFHKRTFEICKILFHDDSDFWTINNIHGEIIKQSVYSSGLNYRHGGTYLTPSKETAIRYASHNPYGSEAISKTIALYNKIKEYDLQHGTKNHLDSNFIESPMIAIKNVEQILIEISDVRIEFVRSENNKNPEDVLFFIQDSSDNHKKGFDEDIEKDLKYLMLKETDPPEAKKYKEGKCNDSFKEVFPVFHQQSNFELVHPIPSSQLRFFKINFTNRDLLEFSIEELKFSSCC